MKLGNRNVAMTIIIDITNIDGRLSRTPDNAIIPANSIKTNVTKVVTGCDFGGVMFL